jgi:VanZ family protein
MLNLRARRVWLALGAVGIALAFILSLWPHGAPGLETVPDKIQHTVGYALVVLWFVGLVHSRWYWRVFLAAVLLGGLIEILQSFTDTRTGDWADEGADALGALLGLIGAYLGVGGWAARLERRLGLAAKR